MQITVYSLIEKEQEFYKEFEDKYKVKFHYTKEMPSLANVSLAKESKAVIVITTPIDENLIQAFYDVGVRYISTRTAGYDHINLAYAKKIKMGIGNSSYSSANVAEYTLMLMLMAKRNIKTILMGYQNQDFSLKDVQGGLLKGNTIGIVGTGKIGMEVAYLSKAFGCKVLAYNRTPKEQLKDVAEYVSFDELLCESDIISLHLPATEETKHCINQAALKKMKKSAILINTARGSLIDTKALIEALEQKQIAQAALDVIEDETMYYYHSFKNEPITHREMAILRCMPNVIMTPHTAFHTKEASVQMAQNAVLSCIKEFQEERNPWKII